MTQATISIDPWSANRLLVVLSARIGDMRAPSVATASNVSNFAQISIRLPG